MPFDGIRTEPARAFEDAADRMAHAGATLTRAKLPVVEEVLALSAIIYTPEAWAEWRDLIETRPEAVFPPILARFRSGRRAFRRRLQRSLGQPGRAAQTLSGAGCGL